MTRTALASAVLATSFSSTASAATATDNMLNVATVVDSCYVVATGVDFGVVTTPMAADIPGALPNLSDQGAISISVPLVGTIEVPVTSYGVTVICTTTPASITVDVGGSTPATNIMGGSAGTLSGVMTKVGSTETLNYDLAFLAVSTPADLPVGGLPLALPYAGAFLVDPTNTKIPVQSIAAPGIYQDTAVVTVTY